MGAANESSVLSYMQAKKTQFGNRAVCLDQGSIAAALGVSVEQIEAILSSLQERGKVHMTSGGDPRFRNACWAIGRGFGR